MEDQIGIAEQLLKAIRDGIDAARYFARHEALAGMTADDALLVELANTVEESAAELDDAMMALLEYQGKDLDVAEEEAN